MIALRLNFTDVICDDSLRHIFVNGRKVGCRFDVRLSYYRGHFLSTIDELRVKIDGEEISQQDIAFCLHGKAYGIAQLYSLGNVFWPVAEPAAVEIFRDGGFADGDHDVEFIMFFRSPYMEIGPDTVSYTHLDVYKRQLHPVPLFSHGAPAAGYRKDGEVYSAF